jgi:hypothetical protein
MSTRASIAVSHGGNIKAIYCHFDGYLEHVGKMLHEHYNSARANHLVSLGDLSQLHELIEPVFGDHSYNDPEDSVCIFYGRDRGDKDVSWQSFDNVKDWLGSYDADFFYIMDKGVWYVQPTKGRRKILARALAAKAKK